MDDAAGKPLQLRLQRGLTENPSSGSTPPVHVSIGMATAVDGTISLQTLLHEADLRMYGHKRARRAAILHDAPTPLPE